MEKHIIGKVILYREKCPICGDWCLSGNKQKFECYCGSFTSHSDIDTQKIISAQPRRHIHSEKSKQAILDRQDGKCYWCNRKFGSFIYKNNKIIKLSMCIDHVIPHSYCYHDGEKNLVGACNICNSFKSSKMFDSEKECREHLLSRWAYHLKKNMIFEEDNF
jgi:5-methylcytosine-specific restriction endonuclease McrA